MMRAVGMLLALALFLPCSAAGGQVTPSGDPDLDARLRGLLESSFLTINCVVPPIQPQLVALRRSWSPDLQTLKQVFLGDSAGEAKEEEILSPLWGRGHRLKVSAQREVSVRVGPEDQEVGVKSAEVVVMTLDVYPQGFVYANNVPHRPVYATDVEIQDETAAEVKYYEVFDEEEGRTSAENLLAEMVGAPVVAPGFQSAVQTAVQQVGERLFVYRAYPEYLTSYNVYSGEFTRDPATREVLATQPVAVPVHDAYIHVTLDGDKLLAGLAYFWDGGMEPRGTPRECIHAYDAVATAQTELFKYFDGEPPLLTVSGISLGFVQDRDEDQTLIPAWLFDAWYTQTVIEENEATLSTGLYSGEIVEVPLPFAVDALTGEMLLL